MNCNRLLVPVDFSEESAMALEWAVRLALQESKPTIYLLYVLPYVIDPTYLVGWTDDLVGLRMREAERDLMEWQTKIPKHIPSIALLRKGRVAEEIAHVCHEKAIDMVIMTTRERRGIERAIHPNASEKTVHAVRCPVLILHLNSKTAPVPAETR